jgi:hypothetical protein
VTGQLNTAYGITTVTDLLVASWRTNCENSLTSNEGQHPETWSSTTQSYSSTVPEALRCYEAPDNCNEDADNLIGFYTNFFWQQSILAAVEDFKSDYMAHCLGRAYVEGVTNRINSDFEENFTVEFQDKEYHYTLYYYDLAGNLTRNA